MARRPKWGPRTQGRSVPEGVVALHVEGYEHGQKSRLPRPL